MLRSLQTGFRGVEIRHCDAGLLFQIRLLFLLGRRFLGRWNPMMHASSNLGRAVGKLANHCLRPVRLGAESVRVLLIEVQFATAATFLHQE